MKDVHDNMLTKQKPKWKRVWVIQYMKRWEDEICDKSIDSIWENEEDALHELKNLRAKDDGFYYVIDDKAIIPTGTRFR